MWRSFCAVVVALVALSSCASQKYVVSDVTRFHTMSAAPSGQTFAIVALDDEQEQSIAFRQFGDQINARLSQLGLRQYNGSGGPSAADYVVTLRYAIYGPTPDVRTRSSGFSGRFGFWYGPAYWRSGPFGYGGYGYDPFWDDQYTDTQQLFTRRVELNVYRGSSYESEHKERVFEGRAVSSGLNGQIEPVMPYILDAIFKDFPGRSGETKTVSVEVPADVEQATATRPSPRSAY